MAVSALRPAPASLGYRLPPALVDKPRPAGSHQLLVAAEIGRLTIRFEQALSLRAMFVQHETAAGRDLDRTAGLQVAVALAQEGEIDARGIDGPGIVVVVDRPRLDLQEQERVMIERALERFDGNRRKAAEALNISTVTLWRKMKQFGISS